MMMLAGTGRSKEETVSAPQQQEVAEGQWGQVAIVDKVPSPPPCREWTIQKSWGSEVKQTGFQVPDYRKEP